MQDKRLTGTNFLGNLFIAFSLAGLALEALDLAADLTQHVVEASEI